MSWARIRRLLAATAVAAVMSYGLAGHGVPQVSAHDDMAGAAVFCLLVVTLLGYTAAPRPEERHSILLPDTAPPYAGAPPRAPLDGRARASPSALQRFLN